mmetsp:Transcript_20481/g.24887  ORF Transcript_20481/g.24887 Transcript_20481/m.24887 type:complete len:126 (-) Transcript_20481:49-426(-)
MVLKKYTNLVSEWFRSFRFRPQLEPKNGAIMRVNADDDVQPSTSKPKHDKTKFHRWNANDMVNDLSKGQKRALVKALNVRPTKKKSIECWKCSKSHHLRDCPEFNDEASRRQFFKEYLKSKKSHS